MRRIKDGDVLAALQAGKSFGEISALLGFCSATVRKAARRAGATRGRDAKSPLLAERAKARLAEMIVARDRAYLRAMREGLQPLRPKGGGVAQNSVFSLVGAPENLTRFARTPGDLPAEWPEVQAWKRARDQVFKENLGLLSFFGMRSAARAEDFGELAEGFLRAIDLWSPDGGTTLAGYAARWIKSFALVAHKRRESEAKATGRGEGGRG